MAEHHRLVAMPQARPPLDIDRVDGHRLHGHEYVARAQLRGRELDVDEALRVRDGKAVV